MRAVNLCNRGHCPTPAIRIQPARGAQLVCHIAPVKGQAFKLSALSSVPAVQDRPPSGSAVPAVAGFVAVGLAVAFVLKKLSNNAGSSSRIDVQGHPGQLRSRKDMFMNDVMKNVNTMPMPSLSDEQITAARERRLKERGNVKGPTLEDIILPDNHPWATRAPGSQQQTKDNESVRARMPPRRPGAAPQPPMEDEEAAPPSRGGARAPPSQVPNDGQRQQSGRR